MLICCRSVVVCKVVRKRIPDKTGQKPMEPKTIQSKPSNLVQTIERVSLILDRVGQNSQGMSIRDLSSGLNLPKGTIHRILSSLSYFGYIRQD